MKLISVKEFIDKYNSEGYSITSSTIYYLVQKKIVTSKIKKTKYGQRKVFDEELMLKECKYRHVIPCSDEELLAVSLECSQYEAQRLRDKQAKRKGKGKRAGKIAAPTQVNIEPKSEILLHDGYELNDEENHPVEIATMVLQKEDKSEQIVNADDVSDISDENFEKIEINVIIDPSEFENL